MRWITAPLVGLVGLVGGCDVIYSLERGPDAPPPADAPPPDSAGPELGSWQQATALPDGREYNHGHAAFVGDTLYHVGGFTAGESAIVLRARFTNGVLEGWTETTPMPAPRALGDVVTLGGRIYVVAGANNSTAVSTVYVAEPAADGAIPSWSSLAPLPTPRKANAAAAANGYLYAFGGADSNNTRVATVWYARVRSGGDLDAWQEGEPLPAPRANFGGVAARGFLYAIGGDESDAVKHASVVYASLDPADGHVGAWATTTELPFARRSHVALTDGTYIYVIGGVGTNALADVIYSRINDDGTLGPWQPTAPLLLPRYRHAGVLANGVLFVLGGAEATTSVEQSMQQGP